MRPCHDSPSVPRRFGLDLLAAATRKSWRYSFLTVEFRVLGPLQVWNDQQRVALGGPQSEKVLAALLLAGGRVVPLDVLIDTLWDGVPPPTAKHQVHKLIANLRRKVPGSIETDGPGYRAQLDGATLDATTFTERAAVPTIASLTAALALWRGPALAGIDSRTLQASAAALNERRLATVETLIDLRLAAGQAAAVAAELPAVIAEHPLREGLRSRLMVALYRCGRQAEALSVYAETRALLADQVGLDPGPELIRLHQQLLRADPALDPPAPKASCTLPYDLPDFYGRTADLDRLLSADGAVVINAINGMAGVGKTALAVHAAHRMVERYPDGQLFCDLHAHTPGAEPVEPETALELLLRMLGVAPEVIPEGLDARTARWRTELAGRKVLVVLDNAATAAQVRPLLPGTSDCLVLVTSRRRLGMIEGATMLSLDVLPPAEALELFGAVAGVRRVAASQQPRLRWSGCAGTCRWRFGSQPPGWHTVPCGRLCPSREDFNAKTSSRDGPAPRAGGCGSGCRLRVRPVLRGPGACAATDVPAAGAASGRGLRRLLGGGAGAHLAPRGGVVAGSPRRHASAPAAGGQPLLLPRPASGVRPRARARRGRRAAGPASRLLPSGGDCGHRPDQS